MQRDEWSILNRNLSLEWRMPNGFVNYAMTAIVWKGLPALRRQWRGLWEHDDRNRTVSTAWLYKMEPFVWICHSHFPLKQCTLEADPHLVGINSLGLMTGKWKMPPLSILKGNDYRIVSKGKREETTKGVQINRCDSVLTIDTPQPAQRRAFTRDHLLWFIKEKKN